MNDFNATEQAYKNGYKKGVNDFAKKLKQMLGVKDFGLIDKLTKEMAGE